MAGQSRSLQELISSSPEFGIQSSNAGASASIGGPDAKAPSISLPEQDPIGDIAGIIGIIAAL